MKQVEDQNKERKSSFLDRLLEPSVPVETREQRRKIIFQLKILYSVLFIIPLFIIWELFFIPSSGLLTDMNFILAVFIFFIFGVGVFLSKRNMVDHASLLIIIATTGAIFALSIYNFAGLAENYPKDDVNVLLFLILPIILTITLFDIKKAVMIIAVDFTLILSIPFFFPHITINDMMIGPFTFLGLVSLFLILFSHHQRGLESDRSVDLKDREEKLRSMLASSPEGLILSDLDANIINCNRAVAEMMGYESKDELIGKNSFEFIPSSEMEKAGKNYNITLREGSVRDVEYTIKRKDGSTFQCLLSSSVIRGTEGEPKALIATIKDITKKKETERWEKLLDAIVRTDIHRGNQLINGYLDLLLDTDLNDFQKDMLARALSASKSQNELIRKIEILRSLGKERAKGTVDPIFLLKDTIKVYQTEMLKNGIEFFDEIEEVNSKVVSEGRGGVLIESVFANLLDKIVNDPEVDRMKVITEEIDDHVKISFISDRAVEEDVKNMLEGYIRRPGMIESELNIYLVKNIVETFGGKVGYNEYENGGSRFDIWLRKAWNHQ